MTKSLFAAIWVATNVVALGAMGCAAVQPPANAESPPASVRSAEPIKVACVGEQTTHSAHREYDPEYPQRLATLLGSGYEVRNFGLPKGRILRNGQAPKSEFYLDSPALQESLAFAPDIVVVGPWGRHDTYPGNWPEFKSEFATDLEALLSRYTAMPAKPIVLVALPLPAGGEEVAPISELREPTLATATRLALPTIDLWSAFLGRTELYKDPTHLLPEGQQHHAQVVATAIFSLKDAAPITSNGAGTSPTQTASRP